jgi:pyruvate dehydrogenase E2 component (dihydrolipoamide acetyltransferase)
MGTIREVVVPDIGDFKDVPVIEILVKPGDRIEPDTSLVTLESDKATMEVPAPWAGVVRDLHIRVGDKVAKGASILSLETDDASLPVTTVEAVQTSSVHVAVAPEPLASIDVVSPVTPKEPALLVAVSPRVVEPVEFATAHASPSIRRFARELGVDLGRVTGSGPKGRILKEDVQGFVKKALALSGMSAPVPASGTGDMPFGLPAWPNVDFSRFGPVDVQPMSRIKRISGPALHRNWLQIPHITQQDEADITDLEAFRKSLTEEAQKQGVKLTPLALIIKACVAALKVYPEFNSSLAVSGDALVLKRYYNIGVAVDTPGGLVVPIVRDADQKGIFQLARELAEVSARARDGKLGPADLQGGTFSISSLGGIGGMHFTPIINAPEVAILGVSRSSNKPVWKEGAFVPRLMLPLSLSYDHRAIDGAQGARFITCLNGLLTDIRRVLI